MQEPLKPLIESFEAKTGHKVKATYGQEDGTKQQIIKGEAFDVPVLETTGKTPITDVTASGNVIVSSGTPVAKIAIGVAVLKGAPKPDICTAEAVKRMMLNAKAISYPDLAALPASGISVNDAIKKMGIADQMLPKTKFGRGGAGAMALVVSGDAEIGFTFLPGIVNPGVGILWALCRPTNALRRTWKGSFLLTRKIQQRLRNSWHTSLRLMRQRPTRRARWSRVAKASERLMHGIAGAASTGTEGAAVAPSVP